MSAIGNFIKENTEVSTIINHIIGCGIIEIDNSGNALIATNLMNQDYVLPIPNIYITKLDPSDDLADFKNPLGFIHNYKESIFTKEFAVNCGFYFVEQIDEIFKCYFFSSDSCIIYNEIVNNPDITQKFIDFFKFQNQHIIKHFTKIRANFDKQQSKYFREPNNLSHYSEKETFINFLNKMQLSKENINISNEEWKLITTHNYEKIYGTNISHIMNVSKKDITTRINSIKAKLTNKQQETITVE